MKIHTITKDQFDADGNYIGDVDLSDFDGAKNEGSNDEA